MPLAALQILRSRWFALCVHAALWVVLYLAVLNLRGKAPGFSESAASALQPQPSLPVGKLDALFASGQISQAISNPTNIPSPFFTRYFVPPAPAPPPAPTTRKIEITYQGFYQTTDGPKHAVLSVAGGLMVAQVGALVATNVYVADADLRSVVLTNTAAQTNTLTLNTKKEIEVPIR
ncbi:MAG TPA: hypothetical protein VJA21_14825 [Verrucomicrobiae bacterium]